MDLVPKEYKRNNDIISPQSAQSANGRPVSGGVKLSKITGVRRDYLRLGITSGLVLLALFLATWAGLAIYKNVLVKKIENLKNQHASVFSSQDKISAENIADFENRAKAAQDFLNSHVYTSAILGVISATTLPQVKWDTYTLILKDKAVSLKGQAASYLVLAKQILAFEQNQDNFLKVSVSDIGLNKEGTVGFSLSLIFNSKILQGQ